MSLSVEDHKAAEAERQRGMYWRRKSEAAAKQREVEEQDKAPIAATCSEWTANHVRLVPQSSAVPGPFNPWAHQRAWLNLPFLVRGPRTLVIQKCARAGFTKCIVAVAAFGALCGKNFLLVMPRLKDSQSIAVDNLMPTLEACFGVEARAGLPWTKSELHIRPEEYSPAAAIKLVHGVSPDLRRAQTALAAADELDAFPLDVGGDGDLFERLDSRLRESQGRLLAGSTPTRRGSLLDQAMSNSELTFSWHWACPSCAAWQVFDWDRMADTRLACQSCGEAHTESVIRKAEQRWQASDGRYIGDDGQTLSDGDWPHAVGFKINALAIPSLPWADLVRADKRCNTPEKRKVFLNEIVGLAYGFSGRNRDAAELMDERQYLESDPERCRVVGADVQTDRIEAALIEWDADERAYILDYAVLPGVTDQPGKGAWLKLGSLVDTWQPSGGMVDAGFRGDGAYEFCRDRYGWRALKGTSQALAAGGLYRVSNQKDRQADLIRADVSMAKEVIYGRLSDEKAEAPWFRFNRVLEEAWFHGLLSEELRIVNGKNRWVLLQEYNEPLDTLVYSYVGQKWLRERLHWEPGQNFPEEVPQRFYVKAIGWD